jgi:hypothetical protein
LALRQSKFEQAFCFRLEAKATWRIIRDVAQGV